MYLSFLKPFFFLTVRSLYPQRTIYNNVSCFLYYYLYLSVNLSKNSFFCACQRFNPESGCKDKEFPDSNQMFLEEN